MDRDVAGEIFAVTTEVTGWSNAIVPHYATSLTCNCVPICGHEEMDCPVADQLYGSVIDA